MKIRDIIRAFIAPRQLGANIGDMYTGIALSKKQIGDAVVKLVTQRDVVRLARGKCRGNYFLTPEAMESARPALEAIWAAQDEATTVRRREDARLRGIAKRRLAGVKAREPKPPKPPKPPKTTLRKAGSAVRIEAAPVKRGPAYLPGDPMTAPRSAGFRHVVYPRMPDPCYTNTFSTY